MKTKRRPAATVTTFLELEFLRMSIVTEAGTIRSGYPFNATEDAYIAEQRLRETRDLMREVEAAQWLALEYADANDGTRDYLEYQLPAMLAELERRQGLLKSRSGDPLRPSWPKSDTRFQDRINAVRDAWPIERFCRELLLMDLVPAGSGKWKGQCPLPGHDDTTPSFHLDTEKDLAYCFGCLRGGDVLKLTQFVLNLDRFTDALTALEREGPSL